jgi:polyhydroxyalkanoate synthesis repressor PhaR
LKRSLCPLSRRSFGRIANHFAIVRTTAENHASKVITIRKFAARSTAKSCKNEYFQIPAHPHNQHVSAFFVVRLQPAVRGAPIDVALPDAVLSTIIRIGLQRKKEFRLARKSPILMQETTRVPLGSTAIMPNSVPITIKKYANRRLYNTASSAYVTLSDLAKMVKSGEDFVVFDAKTNDDITRSVLTQIIFEQEGIEGQSLLPTTFLRQLIRFYGDSMQALLPSYLEFSIDRFSGEKQAMREAASRMFGPESFSAGSFAALQELTKKNLAAFNQALGIFSPFAGGVSPQASMPGKDTSLEDLDELRNQLSDMQRKLESFAKKS